MTMRQLLLLLLSLQIAGVAMTTAGFVIAVRTFGIRYDLVAFNHGIIGVAILVLVYSQVRAIYENNNMICSTVKSTDSDDCISDVEH